MPIVSSYFRRSPGAAAQASETRYELDVAIYGADGATLLRDQAGTRHGATGLTFSSTLPGGGESAAFSLPERVARGWKGRAGLKCVIRKGNTIVWWGWVEDIRWPQRSFDSGLRPSAQDDNRLQVTCLGPWQVLGQRLASFAYTGTVYGSDAIGAMLRSYCAEISTDHSQLAATGVNIAPLTYDRKALSELVKLVCDGGNSAGRRMLFEIEPPTGRSLSGYPTSLLTNSNLETGTTWATGWAWTQATGNPAVTWVTTPLRSVIRAAKYTRGTAAGTQSGNLNQTVSGLSAATAYTFDYYVYFSAVALLSGQVDITWQTAAGVYISTDQASHVSAGAGWYHFIDTFTSPAGTGKAIIRFTSDLPDAADSYVVWDDMYMYTPGSAVAIDTAPRARLWARDLTAADYLLYTGELATGLNFNESTRELVNRVDVDYSGGTTTNEDATSIALYRRRDTKVDAGAVSATAAAAIRDTRLAMYKDPLMEPGAIQISAPGPVRTSRGRVVDPVLLRAGDRLQVADGRQAGTIMLLTRVSWNGGVVSCRPETGDDVAAMLVR